MLTERLRQDVLKAEGRFSYTCADPQLGRAEKLAILVEEVGEVAREVLAHAGLVQELPDTRHLKKELVQVAAIALAWVEGLNEESQHHAG